MNKSKIEAGQPGQQNTNEQTAQNQQVCQPNANTNVVGSLFQSREIKFRALIKSSGELRDITGFEFRQNEFITLFFEGGFRVEKINNVQLIEYTGREDAQINGNEVYECDIIENCDTKDLQVVYWNENESAWYCRYVYDEKRIVSLADSLGNLNKKVGNIFVNPELLQTL